MLNTTFDLLLEKDGEKQIVKVTVQEINPFRLSDVMTSALNVQNMQYQVGTLAEKFIENIVISPKDLKQRIEDADNAQQAITDFVIEVRSFCDNSKRYCLLQTEGKNKFKDLEPSNS
jgi:hypothetical protein